MLKRYLPLISFALLFGESSLLAAGIEEGFASGEYLLYGKSMFDFSAGTNAYLSGGVPMAYPVTLSVKDGKARFDGLLGPRTSFPSVTGEYKSESGTISFQTPTETIKSTKPYTTLASTDESETLLCGVEPYGLGYVEALDHLTFSVSEDGRSLYPSSGFGAGTVYLIGQDLYQIGGYEEVIYDALLLKKEAGIAFNIDKRNVDVANTFPGLTVKTVFRVYNTGEETSEYVVASSNPDFYVVNPAGEIRPGEFEDIELAFCTGTPGEHSSTITLTNEDRDIIFEVKGVCAPFPEYSKIVKEGEFSFSTNPIYPWVISDAYGETPVAVNGNSGLEKTESPLYAEVMVSEKHAGILSWEGYCDPYHPMRDAFAVMVDEEIQYVSPQGGGDTSSSIEIAPGKHRVEFSYIKGPRVNGTYASGDDYAWIRNLSLAERSLEQNGFSVSAQTVSFQPKTIVKKGAEDKFEITVRNEGWDSLELLEVISDNDAFSAELPGYELSTFESAPVEMVFHTFTPGKHSGKVTIRTNAGDIVVRCSGEAVEVPDYTPIVAEGDFDFDTSILYPFVVEGDKAYNSSSMKKDRKATISMLQANFEVPEGYYGELSWEARVSATDISGEDLADYATIFIDGDDIAQDFYGERRVTQLDFSPANVNFYPGSHFVCFAYSQAGDSKFEGDDRIEVSGLSLQLKRMKDSDLRFWGSNEANFSDVRVSKAYTRSVKLVNFGTQALQIKGCRGEGDFSAEINLARLYNTFEEIEIPVSFIPVKAGRFEGDLTLDTSAGEMTIHCIATVVDDPATLLIEDFEDDMRLWKFIDVDGDEATWAMVATPLNAYHGEGAIQSYSIHSDFSEGPLDDVALSPEFAVPQGGATVNFWLACYNPSEADMMTLYAGEGVDFEKFTEVKHFDLKNAKQYYNLYECDLEGFDGKSVRLAFRHKLEKSVMSFLAIDDITVTAKNGAGVTPVRGEVETVGVEYYNLQGVRLQEPCDGVCIRRTIYSDGTSATEKINFNGRF